MSKHPSIVLPFSCQRTVNVHVPKLLGAAVRVNSHYAYSSTHHTRWGRIVEDRTRQGHAIGLGCRDNDMRAHRPGEQRTPERYTMTTTTPIQRVSFFGDIYNGAVHGDFTPHLGMAGHITQAVLSFVPILGNLCALRDFIADRRKHDNLGAFLNLLAIVPFFGGFPKTAAIMRSVRHVGLAARALRGPSSN